MTFTPVVVEGRDSEGEGLIEVELGSARVRIGRRADVGTALAVIGARPPARPRRRSSASISPRRSAAAVRATSSSN